jgi:thiosulfate/3-mercaptopyruvate sulfurtransferase
MRIIMRLLVLFVITVFVALETDAQQFENTFVDPDWLLPRLENDSIVILHLDKSENYTKGHIPGALFMAPDAYTTIRDSLYYQMPDATDFAGELRRRGIDKNKLIVISSGWDTFAHAFRLYVTLEYFGLSDQAFILNGGIRGWNSKGFPVSRDTVIAEPADNLMKIGRNNGILVEKEWIRSNLNNPEYCLIDARKDSFYSGIERGNYKRPGHIKGARNLTWTSLVDEYFILHASDTLRTMFDRITNGSNRMLIMYCHVGLRASVLYTVGKALGYDVRLYDGSFNEWDGLDPSYPVQGE